MREQRIITVDASILQTLMDAARKAGSRIMADWRTPGPITRKPDGSPVTQTDDAAEAIVVASILTISDHPIVAEEAMHHGQIPNVTGGSFWLVDALDGTRDFVRGQPDFTVNIALIEDGIPSFGLIYAPVTDTMWHTIKGGGAWCNDARMQVAKADARALRLLSGVRSAEPVVLEPFVGPHAVASRTQRSSSLKFCLVADGQYDLYSRLGHTYEWDTAAGDAILREAGGCVLDLQTRQPIIYGKAHRGFENDGFIAGPLCLFRTQGL